MTRASRAWAAVLLAGALALSGAGCAALRPPELTGEAHLGTDSGPFVLQFAEGDRKDAEAVTEALGRVTPALARWGGLRDQVTLQLFSDHAKLEAAVDKRGYEWLRAWARYDQVYLQAPRTWGLFGGTRFELDELLLHELTHCVMYQHAATRTTWPRKQIPLWFREGMASVSANQGYRWPTLEDLATWLLAHPAEDPVLRPDPLVKGEADIVYGAAHHAFAFLVRRYGEPKVNALLRQMSVGDTFPEAFAAVIGLPAEAFAQDFRTYVRLRGYRFGRLKAD